MGLRRPCRRLRPDSHLEVPRVLRRLCSTSSWMAKVYQSQPCRPAGASDQVDSSLNITTDCKFHFQTIMSA